MTAEQKAEITEQLNAAMYDLKNEMYVFDKGGSIVAGPTDEFKSQSSKER